MTLIHPALFFLILAYSLGAEEPPTRADTPLSGPVKGAPIKRYGVVDQGMLSRSSRPTAAGYTWLRQAGVKSLVNFTDEDPGDTFFTELGFESHLWLPIVDGKPPTDAQVEQFLSVVRGGQAVSEREKPPTEICPVADTLVGKPPPRELSACHGSQREEARCTVGSSEAWRSSLLSRC
jgi:hypothetical protein